MAIRRRTRRQAQRTRRARRSVRRRSVRRRGASHGRHRVSLRRRGRRRSSRKRRQLGGSSETLYEVQRLVEGIRIQEGVNCTYGCGFTGTPEQVTEHEGVVQEDTEVALILDYDGCVDIFDTLKFMNLSIKHEDTINILRRILTDILKRITCHATSVTIFVGSNRQSHWYDDHLCLNQRNFRKRGAYSLREGTYNSKVYDSVYHYIAEAVIKKFPHLEEVHVSVNKALVADKPYSHLRRCFQCFGSSSGYENPFTHDEMKQDAPTEGAEWGRLRTSETYRLNNRDYARPPTSGDVSERQPMVNSKHKFNDPEKTSEKALKWMIVQNCLRYLKGKSVRAYYIDDSKDFLMHVGGLFTDAKGRSLWGPEYENISFKTVHFDWYGIKEEYAQAQAEAQEEAQAQAEAEAEAQEEEAPEA